MTKDVGEFIRRLEAAGLTIESTPGHYRVLRDGKPLRKANGCRSCCRSRPTHPVAPSSDRRPTQARHPHLVRPFVTLHPKTPPSFVPVRRGLLILCRPPRP